MGRKKLERTTMLARVASNTPEKVKEIAAKLGYVYGEEGSAGQLLDAVALLKDFLEPMGLSARELADAVRVPYQQIDEIVNEKHGITISTALKLSKFFGNSSQFWLNLQQNWELFYVLKEEEHEVETITSLTLNNHEHNLDNEDIKIISS